MKLHKFSEALQYGIFQRFGVFNPLLGIRRSLLKMYRDNDLNICYNKYIPASYDPDKKNILIAIESPGLIDHFGWIKPGMQFEAEISFQNYFKLDRYLCPRTIYACNDNFVDMVPWQENVQKNTLISMIYSDKQLIEGHRFRHQVAGELSDRVDLFGGGAGKPLKNKCDSLLPYRFQVVIENGKYPEYVTEKFFDCLKTGTVPVYWGGETAIQKMGFDPDGILFFDSIADLRQLLETKVNADYYESKLSAIKNNYERLREIRQEEQLHLALHSVKHAYHHTTASYLGHAKSRLNLMDFE